MRIELDFGWGKNERTIRSSSSSFLCHLIWWNRNYDEKKNPSIWLDVMDCTIYTKHHLIFMQILAMKLVLNKNFCKFSGVFWLGSRSAFKRKEISIRQAYKQYDSKCIIRNIYELKIRRLLFKWDNCGEEATIIAKKLGKIGTHTPNWIRLTNKSLCSFPFTTNIYCYPR